MTQGGPPAGSSSAFDGHGDAAPYLLEADMATDIVLLRGLDGPFGQLEHLRRLGRARGDPR